MPPERRREGLIPLYGNADNIATALRDESDPQRNRKGVLSLAVPAGTGQSGTNRAKEFNSPALVPLYAYRHASDGTQFYAVDPDIADSGATRLAEPVCRVWRNPMALLILDSMARPVLTRGK